MCHHWTHLVDPTTHRRSHRGNAAWWPPTTWGGEPAPGKGSQAHTGRQQSLPSSTVGRRFIVPLNIMQNIVPFHITDKRNNINITKKILCGYQDYCYAVSRDKNAESFYVPLLLSHDGFCLGLMIWASGSMVFILHSHKQRVQYIHRNNLSPRSSPESRATRSILVLACFFLSLWMLSSIFHVCLSVFNNSSLWLRNTSTLLTTCFPTLSPYILMRHDPRVSTLYSAWIRKQNPLNLS
ncbi:vomeronasal type-1 receptor 4-like [Lynx canadensis]|uniref:vomeronasal type-1 receptor 4-like n=1 Tax=Lynx canadensis TaxID=61383 RepID=UPI0011AFDAF2|nr:vomeronasal type-1 receptor 4-like [Lynx canadensis]